MTEAGERNQTRPVPGGQDDGFTLIELMVVVLIIAILLAIAIPTFLGARSTANARAAESDLTNALTAEMTYYSSAASFSGYLSDLTAVEPDLGWTTVAPSTKGGNVVLVAAYLSSGAQDTATKPDLNDTAVVMQAYGQDGNCYAILQVNSTTNGVSPGTWDGTISGACSVISTLPASSALNKQGKASSNVGTSWSSANWYPTF